MCTLGAHGTSGGATGRPADGEPEGQPQQRRARGPRNPADAPEQQIFEEHDEPAGNTATPVEDALEAELADQPGPARPHQRLLRPARRQPGLSRCQTIVVHSVRL